MQVDKIFQGRIGLALIIGMLCAAFGCSCDRASNAEASSIISIGDNINDARGKYGITEEEARNMTGQLAVKDKSMDIEQWRIQENVYLTILYEKTSGKIMSLSLYEYSGIQKGPSNVKKIYSYEIQGKKGSPRR